MSTGEGGGGGPNPPPPPQTPQPPTQTPPPGEYAFVNWGCIKLNSLASAHLEAWKRTLYLFSAALHRCKAQRYDLALFVTNHRRNRHFC